MKNKILIVDDEPANLRVLTRIFRDDWTVITASSGKEALELLLLHDVAVIISDQRMPEMTGVEFLKQAAEIRPHTVRIILTGYTDAAALVEAINSRVVYKYVTKPWINEDLKLTVSRALEYYNSTKDQHLVTLENLRLTARLKAATDAFVKLASSIMDLRFPGSSAHAARTSHYSRVMGAQLELEPDDIEKLSLAALLHELPASLVTDEAFGDTTNGTCPRHISMAPQFDACVGILAGVPDLADTCDVIGCVHERFDGRGFPNGLAGEKIPLHARIIAVADAYDRLRSPDSYGGLTHREAERLICEESGTRFDPRIVELLPSLEWVNGLFQTDLTPDELAGVLSL